MLKCWPCSFEPFKFAAYSTYPTTLLKGVWCLCWLQDGSPSLGHLVWEGLRHRHAKGEARATIIQECVLI